MTFSFSHKSFLIIWAIGITIAVSSFLVVEFYESRRLHDQLEIRFNSKVKSLEQSMNSLSELVYSTQKFLQNGNNPTQVQFQHFLNDRTRIGSGIHSLFWLPLIALGDVKQFEEKAKSNGLLGFQLLPRVGQTATCAKWLNSATLPVYYISPQFEASDYLGNRLDTNCEDAAAMGKALGQHEITTSIFNEDGHQGIKLFLPVLNDNSELKGFVVASILFHEFLGVTWQGEINSKDFDISVLSLNQNLSQNQQSYTSLFQSHVNLELSKAHYYQRESHYSKQIALPNINQNWLVSISTIDDDISLLLYGSTAVVLILLLTASISWGFGFYAHRLQISDQLVKEKTRSLAIQATQDELTGLLNRQALSETLENQLSRIENQTSKGFSILFIDLDRFKIVNDSMGHIIGDLLLQQVATRLIRNARRDDSCFRFGGDEFVVCLPNQVNENALQDLCLRFSQLLSKPYSIKDQTCHIGASIGVSIVTSPSQSIASILREADTAMYKAKSSGTEKVIFFDEKMFTQVKHRFALEQELTIAVEQDQLSLAYQPIYCQKTDQVSGFEALLRWKHPKKGWISPDEFIPIAEETGLIIKIGDWIVKKVCQQLEQLYISNAYVRLPRININVSAKQFESNHIVHTLQHALSQYKFPTKLLGVEITESLLLGNSSSTIEALNEIKKLGLTIYLDDFGTGYSSLSVLSDYPVDIVKIDRSFVQNIDNQNHKSAKLCQAIISMSHTISLGVVAEGVETEVQLASLQQFGCNYIQGYLKAKPVAPNEMMRYLIPRANLRLKTG
ncbi:EAL domain-containing protein [Vibrio sp. ZSDE26]|uniref:EAL domain-containing protein n=1 Tax=Vibrio amylolyticus TaxID=2847292 RepID=A0A9X1XMR5_9VIBR|nr:EAL domain-containing protein [Vibrio amylolyticus]MCK6265772.1 EAL domain-containing protein [Vibrio amylolyticus]